MGELLSSRKRRTDIVHVKMLLLLHLNFNNIPYHVPAINSSVIQDVLPKRSTGRDVEQEEVEKYLDLGNVCTDAGTDEV